jgi:hypothetical protein
MPIRRIFGVDRRRPVLYDLGIDPEAIDVTAVALLLGQMLRGPVR